MPDYSTHAEIFGKSCFSCTFCCADTEPEDIYTSFWCLKNLNIRKNRTIMKRLAVINSVCNEWEVKKEEE